MKTPLSNGTTLKNAVKPVNLAEACAVEDIASGDRFLLSFFETQKAALEGNELKLFAPILAHSYQLSRAGLKVAFWESSSFSVHHEMLATETPNNWWIKLEVFNQTDAGCPYFLRRFHRPELVGMRGDCGTHARPLNVDLFFPAYKV